MGDFRHQLFLKTIRMREDVSLNEKYIDEDTLKKNKEKFDLMFSKAVQNIKTVLLVF